MYPRIHVGTRSHQGAARLPQILAGDNGRCGYQFGGLARFWKRYRNCCTVVFRDRCRYRVELGHLPSPSQNRAPYRAYRKVIAMDILVGIIMLAVALLFVGIALDAARRAK